MHKAIRLIPCQWHQVSSSDRNLQRFGCPNPLPQREPARFRYAPFHRFSQWQRYLEKQIGLGCYSMNRTCFMEFFLATFGHLGRVRFTVQNYCVREKCQVPPRAFGWRAWQKPSANFLIPPKLGYSVRTLRPHACLILPCVRSGCLHVKTIFPTKKLKRVSQKGKVSDFTNS